jgi:N-acetyl-anhydromuramyl-L-alanine amidase AmpD
MNKKEASLHFQALSMGETGTMVYIAQKILNTIGYELKEDGIFSLHMEKAVKSFQGTIDTLVIDGVVGYETMKEMDEASSII